MDEHDLLTAHSSSSGAAISEGDAPTAASRAATVPFDLSPDAAAFVLQNRLQSDLEELKFAACSLFSGARRFAVTLSTEPEAEQNPSKLVLEVDSDSPRREFNDTILNLFRNLRHSPLYDLLTTIRA